MKRASPILLALAVTLVAATSPAKDKDTTPACAASCDATCARCCSIWTIQAACDDGSVVAIEGTYTDGRAAERVAADLDQRAQQCTGTGDACARLHLACADNKVGRWRAACGGPLPANAATAAARDAEHADVLAQALALALTDAQQSLATFSARSDLKSSAAKRAKQLSERLPAEHDKLAAVAGSPGGPDAASQKLFDQAAADLRDAGTLVADPKSIDPHYRDNLDKAARDREKAEEKAERDRKKAEEKAERDQKKAEEKAARDQKKAEEKAARDQKKAEEKAAREQGAAEHAAAASAAAAAAAQQKQAENAAALDEAQKSRTAAGITIADADRKAYDAIVLADKWLAQPTLDPGDRKAIQSARDKLQATRKDLAKLHSDLTAESSATDGKKAKATALKQRVRAKQLAGNVDKHYDELGSALRKAAAR